MKKLVWIIAACVVLVLAGGALAMRRHAESSGVMSDLKPYATSDKTLYYDPKDMLKSISAGSVPPGTQLDPVAVRYMRLKNVSMDEVNKIVHRDLTAKDHWQFAASFAFGTGSAGEFIEAHQRVSPTSPAVMPDNTLMVMPDFSSAINWSSAAKAGVLPKPKEFIVMEMRMMPSWEVAWLKLKNLGHNPFSSQNDMFSALSSP